jgi:hypothetical protein
VVEPASTHSIGHLHPTVNHPPKLIDNPAFPIADWRGPSVAISIKSSQLTARFARFDSLSRGITVAAGASDEVCRARPHLVVLRSGWITPVEGFTDRSGRPRRRGAGIPRAVGGVAEHLQSRLLVLQQPHPTTPSWLDDAEQVIG